MLISSLSRQANYKQNKTSFFEWEGICHIPIHLVLLILNTRIQVVLEKCIKIRGFWNVRNMDMKLYRHTAKETT